MDPRVMDKSWMVTDRTKKPYQEGVHAFIEYAIHHLEISKGMNSQNTDKPLRIWCPCRKCLNLYERKVPKVQLHLFQNGINEKYTKWTEHGEEDESPRRGPGNCSDGRHSEEHDCQMEHPTDAAETIEMVKTIGCDLSMEKIEELVQDAEKPLYGGCSNFTKITSMCKLFNLKSKHGASDKFFDELLDLLGTMLPPDNELVKNTYDAKKMMKLLGSGYQKIHVCINNCILYRKKYQKEDKCPTCGESRWKVDKDTGEVYENIPAKVMWYFPIIPRVKAWYKSENISKDLIWHETGRKKDEGVLRHPADSPAWKAIDNRYPEFGNEPRNLRLGISADGVDVNKNTNKHRSVWPILTVVYNLPPWLCMKRKFMMLSILIDGGPCKDICVLLEPFVEDLRILFVHGVECLDAYKQEKFTLRAAVLWTINDYPALGTLCGCPYSGKRGCVVCGKNTYSVRLNNCGKEAYTGHRRYLPYDHPFRKQKKVFNGQTELGVAPEPMTGEQIYEEVRSIENSWGKKNKGIKVDFVQLKPGRGGKMRMRRIERKIGKTNERSTGEDNDYWKKFNVWHRLLPYWRYNLVHHCIDFMHVEKNVGESIVGTLLHAEKKTKDGLKARMDLAEKGLREELQPKPDGKGGYIIQAACCTLTTAEKDMFCTTLSKLRVPQGYCSNFSTLVSCKDRKLIGLKSHDYHMLMQQFLPVAIKSIMPQPTRYAIMRFCYFFRAISSKEIKVEELENLQKELCVTLCLLEKHFPPSFFDIMVHLTVHLTREVELCGPVCFRWMYPFERCMKVIKGHVRNRYRPGGSIAEGNILEETIEMFGEFQKSMKTVGIPPDRHDASHTVEDSDSILGKPISVGKLKNVEHDLWVKAHLTVLLNTPQVDPYVDRHMDSLRNEHPDKSDRWVHQRHIDAFPEWFKREVEREFSVSREGVTDRLRWLSYYPETEVMTYESFYINGYLFRTKSREGTVNQNSGIHVEATDTNIRKGGVTLDQADYYGVLQEIWVLTYHSLKVPLFKCDWVDNNHGVSKDPLGYVLVELDNIRPTEDPFIIATQAKQVFYVGDQENKKKYIVFTVPSKNYRGTDDVDEEFSTVVLSRNDFDFPHIHKRDLCKESNEDYYRPECSGRVVRKSKKKE